MSNDIDKILDSILTINYVDTLIIANVSATCGNNFNVILPIPFAFISSGAYSYLEILDTGLEIVNRSGNPMKNISVVIEYTKK